MLFVCIVLGAVLGAAAGIYAHKATEKEVKSH